MASSTVMLQRDAFKEFLKFPSVLTDPMRAMLVGPKTLLTRYAVGAEKAGGLVGAYDPLILHTYPYPNRVAGSIVDQDYTKVFIDSALLKYWDKQVGVSGTVLPVDGYSNRFRAANYNFKANGTTYPRNSAFGDRDVAVGDVVDVRGIVDSVEYTKRSSVIGFVADLIAGSVGAATAASSNAVTRVASAAATKVGGDDNQVFVSDADATDYDGSVTGDATETYTVEVVVGSVGGDLTTARLRVISASGNDDYYPTNLDATHGVIPGAAGAPFVLTPRGVTLTFDLDLLAIVDFGVSADDLTAGMTWTVNVVQAWTAVVGTSGGTYTGTQDTTYIVTVLTGGLYSSLGVQGPQSLVGPQSVPTGPTILVTTTTGVDASGPTAVSGVDEAVAVGSLGVTISFSGLGLRLGDRFTIPVVASAPGPYKTLILQDNLPDSLTTATPLPDLAVKLYIRKDVQITSDQTGNPPVQNWTQDGTNVTTEPDIKVYDSTWTFSGVQALLPITEGQLYVETRQWLQSGCNNIDSVASVVDIVSKLGVIHPDNPLAWACNLALLSASGSTIWFGAVCGDPGVAANWLTFLDVITDLGGVYNLAPLTFLYDVQVAYSQHVVAQSTPEVGAFRSLWASVQSRTIRAIVTQDTTTDGAVPLATVTADPGTGLLTMVKVPTGNAKFVTNEHVNPLVFPQPAGSGSSTTNPAVAAGDVFRFYYTTDGFGNTTWTEYTVASVVNEDTLELTEPVPSSVVVPQRFEVWHPMSQNNIVDDILIKAQPLKNNRTRVVWPDLADGNPGYFVAAALAALASGVATNQGLKNMELPGFTDMSRSTRYLTSANLLKLINNGVWVVSQDSTGVTYSKSSVNTDVSTLELQEEVITRNVDAIAYYLTNQVQQHVGVANVVDGTVKMVRGSILAGLSFLKSTSVAERLGPPLLSATIRELRAHTLLKDRIVATIQLTIPFPLNRVTVTLQIVS